MFSYARIQRQHAVLLCCCLVVAACTQRNEADAAGTGILPESVQIHTAAGQTATFQVELAATPEHRRTGLMHRIELPANGGMLFDYKSEQRVQMWMKNTTIALDMLFIDAGGTIVHIVENAVPLSESIIDSRVPVRAALELNAGSVAANKIRIGDQVEHDIFMPESDPH
ncbi:MAG: DUF192 domain-containing protein [Gammaproteobacteria bacterium]